MSGPDSAGEQAFAGALDEVLGDLELVIPPQAREKMLAHYRLLVRWNRRMNLTTIREPREIAVRHFGESLFLARELGWTAGSVLDVGSGAGFPGLPLAAWLPDVRVTVLEAAQRKSVFLREVSRSWGSVEVRNERLEGLSGAWDVSVMRAVAVAESLPHLARVSERAAILTGERGVDEVRKGGFFMWEDPLALPWGFRRYLIQGRRPASD